MHELKNKQDDEIRCTSACGWRQQRSPRNAVHVFLQFLAHSNNRYPICMKCQGDAVGAVVESGMCVHGVVAVSRMPCLGLPEITNALDGAIAQFVHESLPVAVE